jgi:uncharacterized protein
MPPEIVQGIRSLISRRAPGLERLTLSWFGGEPLLARDIIEEVMAHAQNLRESNCRLQIASDATTNGFLLTRSVAERLIDLGVSRYQISFDGPREWHDRKRVRYGGRGTFDTIWSNLLDLRRLERDYTITIRVHVDRENAVSIPSFIDSCAEVFGGDDRFEIFIRGLSRFGGPNDATLPVWDGNEGQPTFERLRAYARSRGMKTMELPVRDAICYAAQPSSFVVRSDGRLNKCTIALSHPNNQVGRLLEDGTMQVDSGKVLAWMRGFFSGEASELKCPMKGFAGP